MALSSTRSPRRDQARTLLKRGLDPNETRTAERIEERQRSGHDRCGGSPPRPGEISLAHRGVLFLDELPEFPRAALEALREPLESGHITISRAAQRAEFPARFQLVAAMNPCPCGYLGSTLRSCRCSPEQVARYQGKLSGPLLDRIDLHVEVGALAADELVKIGRAHV